MIVKKSLRKFNTRALTPVISFLLVITIVLFSISVIFVWGLPFIRDTQIRAEKESSVDNLKVINDLISKLTLAGPGTNSSASINNNIEQGYVKISDSSDRIIIYYSYDHQWDFNVSEIDDVDNTFKVTMENGGALDEAHVYWLNDTCFIAGTQVLMADGTYKNIEDVVVGDWVKSYDESRGVLCDSQVSFVHHHSPDEMDDYYLVLDDFLGVTANHRFYTKTGWDIAGTLGVGDSLFSTGLDFEVEVESVDRVFRRVPTYDLSISSCHNFFVNIGEDEDVLVHNAPPDPPTISASYDIFYNDTAGSYPFTAQNGYINYNFSWGDGSFSEGGNSESHNWQKPGFYEIRVKGEDAEGWSDWSDPFGVHVIQKVRKPYDIIDFEKVDDGDGITPSGSSYTFTLADNIEGAVCIDLLRTAGNGFPPSNPAENVPFGRIWVFDLGSLTHYLPSDVTTYENILQNNAVISSDGSSRSLKIQPTFKNFDDIISFNVNMIRAYGGSYSGSGEGIYDLEFFLINNYVREDSGGNNPVSDFKIMFYGENSDAWINYLSSKSFFEKETSNRVIYSEGDKPIIFTSSLVKVNIRGIR